MGPLTSQNNAVRIQLLPVVNPSFTEHDGVLNVHVHRRLSLQCVDSRQCLSLVASSALFVFLSTKQQVKAASSPFLLFSSLTA